MFGPSLMVAPVAHFGARSRKVYLPETANWYDFYTGNHYVGGENITVDAPYERMPLFVKAGSIVPFGPEIEYTAQRKADEITLYVYTGADASFMLYEDEDVNYNYENGKFTQIPFDYNEASKTLTIGAVIGGFEGMLQKREIKVVFVAPFKAQSDNVDGAIGEVVSYAGKPVTVKFK